MKMRVPQAGDQMRRQLAQQHRQQEQQQQQQQQQAGSSVRRGGELPAKQDQARREAPRGLVQHGAFASDQ
jgi:hypothetical protein